MQIPAVFWSLYRKNDILHISATQLFCTLFTQYPADSITNVALSTAVRYTMPVIPLWNSNTILLAKDLNPCTSILFKYIRHLLFLFVVRGFQSADRTVCCHLFCSFLGSSASLSHALLTDPYFHGKGLVMIRSLSPSGW